MKPQTDLSREIQSRYEDAYLRGLRSKLGLSLPLEGDRELGAELLARMAESEADFTLVFRALSEATGDATHDSHVRALFKKPSSYDDWALRWRDRLSLKKQTSAERRSMMRAANPKFIPRNHRIEAAIREAEGGRFESFNELANLLVRPYEDQLAFALYAQPPKPEEEVRQTFCGT